VPSRQKRDVVTKALLMLAMATFGCAVTVDEPLSEERQALPVQATAPCIKVTCDQATCNGQLTVTQTVPANTGTVEVWDATQWGSSGAVTNYVATTTVTQSSGMVVTRTPMSNFRRDDYLCLLTGVVTRNAARNVVGSAPITSSGQLALQPTAVTATVTP
jgi:hypothetical protein